MHKYPAPRSYIMPEVAHRAMGPTSCFIAVENLMKHYPERTPWFESFIGWAL